jgi:hypothetical protein
VSQRPPAPQAFAIASDGSLVASIDGAEALVWTTERGEPLWKCVGEALYVDVAVSTAGVWLIDASGVLEHRRLVDGSLQQRLRVLAERPSKVVAFRDHVVCADSKGVVWLTRGVPIARAEMVGVRDLAIGNEHVGVVDEGGSLGIFELETGQALRRVAVGGPPDSLLWHPGGYWVVAVARRLVPIAWDGNSVHQPVGLGESDIAGMSFGVDGTVAVVRHEPRELRVFGWPTGEPLGSLRIGRDVIGLGSGRRGALWLGLRHGDVQGFDLLTGQIDAAAPHEGRARVPWGVDARVEVARIRGLNANRQAGGLPIAIWVPPEDDDGPPRWVVLLVKGIAITFAVLTVAAIFWVFAVWMNLV